MSRPVLEVKNLRKYFPIKKGLIIERKVGDVRAVDGVSFQVEAGKTYGLVGESGCGKSTTGRVLMRLLKPTAGEVFFDGRDVTRMDRKALQTLRQEIQIIFQDPYASLNPRKTVGQIIMEPLNIHKKGTKVERRARVKELLQVVGLSEDFLERYPHEFSGGQRQRICIARALILNPRLIVCDEPISALDVSIQAQIINLLRSLQEQYGFAYIFIAHDLSVVKYISDTIGVMYLGKLVEQTDHDSLFREPLHPYTQALISSIPAEHPAERKEDAPLLEGEIPSPFDPPSGCAFHPRCSYAMRKCSVEIPEMITHSEGRNVRCHLYGAADAKGSSP